LCDGDNVSLSTSSASIQCNETPNVHKATYQTQNSVYHPVVFCQGASTYDMFSTRLSHPLLSLSLFPLCNIPQWVQLCHNMTPLRTAFKCNKSPYYCIIYMTSFLCLHFQILCLLTQLTRSMNLFNNFIFNFSADKKLLS